MSLLTDITSDFDPFEKIQKTNELDDDSPIQNFYKDQTIFITGATGFLGTLLVEKLLRCCPQGTKLIILVRKKGTKSVDERVRDYFSEQIFDSMRLSNPNFARNVDIVCGQLDAEHFGLDSRDLQLLISNTSIIFHVAATIRFDEHIRTAYDINVKGTETAVSLAKQMPRLKSFVYVSTAYCNCDRQHIDEVFYPPVFSAEQLSLLMNSTSSEALALLNEHLLGDKPNTYTLTKSTAEDLVRKNVPDLPICVFRPPIVFPTLNEPIPFWMKGFNSILALCLASGIGLIRVVMGDDISPDIVPADRCINAMIAAAWYQTTLPQSERSYRNVFNFSSYQDNKVPGKKMIEDINITWSESGESTPSVLWKSNYYMTSSRRVYFWLFYILHFVPAIVFSLGERLAGRKPQVMKSYRKIFHLTKVISYFCLNEWKFDSTNTRAMVNAMSKVDQRRFDASVTNFEWDTISRGSLHRSIGLYMMNERATKEQFNKKMVYIEKADFYMWLIIKGIALYLFLGVLADLINFFFVF